MPYTTNPHLPRLRMQAVNLVRKKGWSTRQVARHTGFNQSTIVRWCQRAPESPWARTIPTRSSVPHSHPNELPLAVIRAVLTYRAEYRRGAKVLHHLMVRDGYTLSLSSVKRILQRYELTRYSKWKKWREYPPRPLPIKPGVLVQIDTAHSRGHRKAPYVYAAIDVCSRWAHAAPTWRSSTHTSARFVRELEERVPFALGTVQSDNGSEFGKYFTKRLVTRGIEHRHTHVRSPSENGHVERFIRTLREECLGGVAPTLPAYEAALEEYLCWYNMGRPHLALDMRTPDEVMRRY